MLLRRVTRRYEPTSAPLTVVLCGCVLLCSAMAALIPDDLHTQFAELKGIRPSSNDGRNIVAPFLELFSTFLSHLDEKFEAHKRDMAAACQGKDNKIDELEALVVAQRKVITNLEEKLEDQCQYSRRESLVFSGQNVPAHQLNEDCIEIACNLVSSKIDQDLHLTPKDISIAHRLGKKPTSGTDRRSIVVRFCRRKMKYDVLDKAKRTKPQGMFVSESLTPNKQKIVSVIRNAKFKHPDVISGYSTSDGTIFMWVKPPNPNAPGAKNSRMTIDSMEKMDKFCMDNFQQPASHYDRPRSA